MTLAIEMGPAGIVALVLGAMLIGVGSQALGEGPVPHEWIVNAAGALIGALLTSEWLVGWQAMRPVWDGVAVVPALMGGLFMAGVANVTYRTVHHDLADRASRLRGRVPATLAGQAPEKAPRPAH